MFWAIQIQIRVRGLALSLLFLALIETYITTDPSEKKAVSASFLESIKSRAQIMNRDGLSDVPQFDLTPEIDGILEKDEWEQAVVWKLPWETNRGENRMAPDQTYVLMATSGQDLHLAFISIDHNPASIRGTLTDRDNWIFDNNDMVGFLLDTFGDGRNAILVAVNAAGVQAEAMRVDRGAEGIDDLSFNFLWHSEVKGFDDGYVAEMTIPLRKLQLSDWKDKHLVMGFLPFRMQPRDFVRQLYPVEWDFNRNCFICQLPGIRIKNPGHITAPVQFIPYASGFAEGEGDGTKLSNHPAELSGSVGIDIKYQTTNSVVDATIFPDFSQVETDAFHMTSNVRFLPRFDERRPFFMERTDLFRFTLGQTLYTRSIVNPTGGIRWTGKTGRHNWAAIFMHDRTGWFIEPGPHTSRLIVDEGTTSWVNLFRYRYDYSPDIMMGGFYSDRITEDGYNRLVNYDAQIGVGTNHTLNIQSLATWNRYPERFGDEFGVSTDVTFDYGYIVRMNRAGRSWNYRIDTRRYGKDLITGTGILQQTDVQRVTTWSAYDFWMDSRYIERIRPGFTVVGFWHLHGGDLITLIQDPDLLTLSQQLSIDIFGINRSQLQLAGTYDYEYVEDLLDNGQASREFDLFRFSGSFRTDVTPEYRISIGGSYGSAVDYRLIEQMDELQLALSNSLFLFDRRVDVSHSMDFMRLSDEVVAQEAMTQRLSAEFQITRSFALQNIMQYRDFRFKDPRYEEDVPDRVRTMQNQVLFRYRINYATAIYLVGFTELGEEVPQLYYELVQDRSQWQVFAKVSWLL